VIAVRLGGHLTGPDTTSGPNTGSCTTPIITSTPAASIGWTSTRGRIGHPEIDKDRMRAGLTVSARSAQRAQHSRQFIPRGRTNEALPAGIRSHHAGGMTKTKK